MSAAWRVFTCCVPFLASIVLGWPWLTDALAQGSHYFFLGWFASLMGLFAIVMVAWVPMLGAAASVLMAKLLRLRAPAVVSELEQRWLLVFGPLIFVAMSFGTWRFMWWSQTPVATEFARYDAAYFLTSVLVVGSLAVVAGAFTVGIVVRGRVAERRV